MKLVFIDLDFWAQHEDFIEELIQTASGNHNIFKRLMEAEYVDNILEGNVEFNCTVNSLVDDYTELALHGLQPTSIAIQFDR